MHNTSRPELSPEDAFVIHVSTLARVAASRYLILHDPDEADDIAQDVTAECLASIRSGRSGIITAGIKCLVRTMVLRRAMNVIRGDDRRDARAAACVPDEGEQDSWMSPEAMVEHAEAEALLAHAVAALPPTCRRVFQMVREDDASYAEVARTLGITRHTVKEHLMTAQRRLVAALTDAGMISPAEPHAPSSRVISNAEDVTGPQDQPAEGRHSSAA